MRTQINVEYEHVKDISAVLASFKMSDPVPSARPLGGPRDGPRDDFIMPQDDNGYDPDVWPPPTPAESNRNRAPVHRDVRQNKRNDPPPARRGEVLFLKLGIRKQLTFVHLSVDFYLLIKM